MENEQVMAEQRVNLIREIRQPEAIQLISADMARKYRSIPISIKGNSLIVAMADPSDLFALEGLANQSHLRIDPQFASPEEIEESIDFNYRDLGGIEKKVSHISLTEEIENQNIRLSTVTDAPVAQALILIIDEAVKARASDIHLQPQEDRLRVRFRIDGTLQDTLSLPTATSIPLISRIKVL